MPAHKKVYTYCLLFTVCLLSSCQFSKPAEKKSSGDTIVRGGLHEFSIINPVLSVSSESANLEPAIFDGLIKIDIKGEPQPNLAFSWNISEDKLKWTFYLKRGVRFHDGKELTADDVVFTYEAVKKPENKGRYYSFFEFVKDIKAIDKYTIEITLIRPYVSFLYGLEVGILPRHLLEGKDLLHSEFNYKPIGTGPYRLDKWDEGEIILNANKDYFNGRPYINRIIIKNFSNQKVMWARLMRGEIDFAPAMTPSDYEIIKNIPFFKTYSVLKPYYYMIAFNLMEKDFNVEIASASPRNDRSEGALNDRQSKGVIARSGVTKQSISKDNFFKDKRVRQALNYAVDKEKLIKEALSGMGSVSAGTIYPLTWAYYQDIKPYPYNPKKALELLKEAGWEDRDNNHILDKNGEELKFTILINKGDEIKERCIRLIQEQLLDIGIKLDVELIDLPSLIKRLLQRDFESHFPEIASINDPDINYQLWHSSQIREGFNMFSYKNQRIDELLEKGRVEFDREKRRGYYIDFQKEILSDPPGIFLFWTEYLIGIHERFKDVKVDWRGTFSDIAEWHVPEEKQKYK
jgi:peptide/nickel transport system substrate-binding protein